MLSNEVLFAKLARRLRLALANLKERSRFEFELRFACSHLESFDQAFDLLVTVS